MILGFVHEFVGKSQWWQNCINSVLLIIERKSFVLALPEVENKNDGKCFGAFCGLVGMV